MAITKMKDDYISFFYKEIGVKFGDNFYFITETHGKIRILFYGLHSFTNFNMQQYINNKIKYKATNVFYLEGHYMTAKGKMSERTISIRIDLKNENWRKQFQKIE